MAKTYDCGRWELCLEKTSSGYYKVTCTDLKYAIDQELLFPNKEKALEEIVSYIEIDTEERGW